MKDESYRQEVAAFGIIRIIQHDGLADFDKFQRELRAEEDDDRQTAIVTKWCESLHLSCDSLHIAAHQLAFFENDKPLGPLYVTVSTDHRTSG